MPEKWNQLPPQVVVEAGQAQIQRTRSHLAYSIEHQMVPMDRSYGGPQSKIYGKKLKWKIEQL